MPVQKQASSGPADPFGRPRPVSAWPTRPRHEAVSWSRAADPLGCPKLDRLGCPGFGAYLAVPTGIQYPVPRHASEWLPPACARTTTAREQEEQQEGIGPRALRRRAITVVIACLSPGFGRSRGVDHCRHRSAIRRRASRRIARGGVRLEEALRRTASTLRASSGAYGQIILTARRRARGSCRRPGSACRQRRMYHWRGGTGRGRANC